MQSVGVDEAMLATWYAPEGALISNDEVLAAIREYPVLLCRYDISLFSRFSGGYTHCSSLLERA